MVRGRGRAHRYRRTAAVAGVAALAVAAAIAVPVVVSGQTAPTAAPPTAVPQAADPPTAVPLPPFRDSAQRLLTDLWGHVTDAEGFELPAAEGETLGESYERLQQTPGAVGVVGSGFAEVRADGQVASINLNLPGINGVYDAVSMPDGRLAVLGYRNQLTEAEREDSPCAEVVVVLLVVELDGSVGMSRVVGFCQPARLLDADSQTAYVVRGTQLVAHDLATGDEQVQLDSAYVLGADYPYGAVAGGRVAVVSSGYDACGTQEGSYQLAVLTAEFDTGATSEHPIRDVGCGTDIGAVRLSPDGRYAAVSYTQVYEERGFELRLAVVDIDTGEVVTDRSVVDALDDESEAILNGSSYSLTTNRGAIVGLAWKDERSLLVASYQMPEEGVHRLADVVEVETITMP